MSGVAKRRATADARGRPKISSIIAPVPKPAPKHRQKSQPLFIPENGEQVESDENIEWEEVEDAELVAATEASLAALEEQEAEDLRMAVQA